MAEAAENESIWEWAANHIAGTYSDPAEAAKKLHLAARYCRLIGGAAITPMIEGHEVMVVVIPIDRADTYPIKQSKKEQDAGAPRRRGVGKATLMTIANAAGVEWLETQRVDDGSDPHYVVYHVEGRYRSIDGQYKPILGDKDNDLRVGSDQIANKSEFEVGSLRATAMRSAITKAKLRGLREAFGVPHGVLESELDKPFVFAKVIFTGRSDDAGNRQMFAKVIAMQQLAATAAMYGGSMPDMQLPSAEPRAALPQRTIVMPPEEQAPPPPPPPQSTQPAPRQQQPAPAPRQQQPAPAPRQAPPARDGEALCQVGKNKGTPLSQLSDGDLEWYVNALQSSIDNPAKERWLAENQRDMNDALDEQDRRNAVDAGPPTGAGQDPDRY